MLRAALYLLIISMMVSCQGKKARESEVLALREMSELATVEYLVTKIIRASDDQTWYKIGDRKILMSCEASIKAGIDLSAINASQVRIEGKSISLVLPRAHLISLNIRPENVKVEYQETGLFRSEFTTSERDQLATQGETQIRNSIDSIGVLPAAETNASVFISNYLKQLGYEKINIRFTNPENLPGLQ